MKRIFSILVILFASVLTTACINNFAIQELNNKAKEYLQAGDVEKAICRYKSSLDLDSSIFETNYNLGVAYISEKDYEDAISVLKNAIKLSPDTPDTYYSLAVALEGHGFDKINGVEKTASNCIPGEEEGVVVEKSNNPIVLSDDDKEEISKLFMESIDNYNHYLSIKPNAEDKHDVVVRIEDLNKELIKYTPAPVVEDKED